MSISTALEVMEDRGTDILNAKGDRHGRVMVNLDEPMNPTVLASLLESSISKWRDQGKKTVRVKLSVKHLDLLEVVLKAGFRLYNCEPGYFMYTRPIHSTADTLPANASQHVGIGAFAINDKREGNTINNWGAPSIYMLASTAMEAMEDTGTNELNAKEDLYGVTVYVDEPMDPTVLASLVESSMSKWRDQGKKVVRVKLPIEHLNLVEVLVKAGFMYQHAEADYTVLYHWIPNTADTLPANASHRVGIGAFVINDKREGNSINNCLIPRPHMTISTAVEAMNDTGTNVLNAEEDRYGGVTVYLDEPMDPTVLASLLECSMSKWRDQGKKAVWLKMPLKHGNPIEPVAKAGFRYHHTEADYLILVHWIPNTAGTLPANASHHVGITAFVINNNREVLVVQEGSGWFKGTGVWKLPTGTVEEGEDISAAAVREVKEETGIETEFVEVLTFRQSHKSVFQKSDIMFVCMLQASSFDIQMQTSEIAAAKWMPIEDYAAQPFVKQNSGFDSVAKICLEKLDGNSTGFAPLPIFSSSGEKTCLYFNKQHAGHVFDS